MSFTAQPAGAAMSTRHVPSLSLPAIAIAAMLPALPVVAGPQSNGNARSPRQDSDQNDHSRLSDAVRRVERDTRGEVLSAERIQYDGRDMHRVKVVDNQGRVRVFMQEPRHEANERPAPREPRRPPPSRGDDD
jgi:hypothetical protein